MGIYETDTEELRKKLLDEIYSGAFAARFMAMILDEDEIRHADKDKLIRIAQRYGMK